MDLRMGEADEARTDRQKEYERKMKESDDRRYEFQTSMNIKMKKLEFFIPKGMNND